MAIIHQFDKCSGVTYAYESISTREKDKRMSRAKSTLIGRVHPSTSEIIQPDERNKKPKVKKEEQPIDYKDLYEKLQKKNLAQSN